MFEFIKGLFQHIAQNSSEIASLTLEHIQLTIASVIVAILIGVPLGIFVDHFKKFKKPILGIANIMQAIPSLALLGFLIPFLGIGEKPAIFMIVIYSLLPIIKNTTTGLESIDKDTLEAAKGIGLTPMQILFKIKLPLALPVIMAGVRISAVASVGLVTIAAFIGAGGLGYLVYAGIRTVDNFQILSGAIPACIIALCMDFVFGAIESLVTPPNMKEAGAKTKGQKIKNQLAIGVAIIVIVVVGLNSIFTSILTKNIKTIVVGSKNYSEQEIVAEMMGIIIEEKTDFKVVQRKGLGSTTVIMSALEADEIDLVVDYTGTIYGSLMNETDVKPPEEIFNDVQEFLTDTYNLNSLSPLGFNNTYVFAVTKETADKYNLETFSDLANASSELEIGCTIEFMNRSDGLSGATEMYGFSFKNVTAIDDSPRYQAIDDNYIQVIDAYSTDAMIKKFDLVTLIDDKNFFPPYYAFPIIRNEWVSSNPEVIDAIKLLELSIDDMDMTEMNYMVDEKNMKAKDVARNYLQKIDLIK